MMPILRITPGQQQAASVFAPAGARPPGAACHRIVIVGGGAGGLELAVRAGDDLGRRGEAEIVLVDPLLTHLWKPLLHEVAAGTLVAEANSLDFLQQARRHRFRFHLGTMVGLDRARREVLLAPLTDAETGQDIAPARRLWYDTLVIAVGCRDHDFGIPGVREHALPLNDADDARRFHRRLLALLARAEMQNRGPVRVAIVGAGATGVELAAELSDASRQVAAYGLALRRLPSPVQIRLIDTSPRLLAAMPEPVAERAQADLIARGIEICLGQRVTEVHPDHLVVMDASGARKRIPADLVAWAAGIRAPDFLDGLDGLESNAIGQLVVAPTLETTRDANVLAFGDCAWCVPAPGELPVPPKAQAAQQEARLLADSLRRRVEGRPLLAFRYRERGALISLGPHEAVGAITRRLAGRELVVEGAFARASYILLYRRHLVTLLGWTQTFLIMLRDWLSGRIHPPVKLH